MALEDFFTLAEMNNGLTTTTRVRELVAAMANEKKWDVKNVGDVTRQWSAVANAIVATENNACLDLFIQLDGLQCIYNWLKDAQKLSNDTSDSFVEESIALLLLVFAKLHVDEKFFTAEIWTTFNDLLFHNNSKVQDKARVLFERKKIGGASVPDVENAAATDDGMGKDGEEIQKYDESSENCLRVASLYCETTDHEKVQEAIRGDPVQSSSSDTLHPGQVECEPNSNKILDTTVVDGKPLDCIGSPSLANPAVSPPACPSIGNTLSKLCCLDVSQNSTVDDRMRFHASGVEDATKFENSLQKLGSPDEPKMPKAIPFPASCDAVDNMNSLTEGTSHSISGDKDLCGEGSSFLDSKTVDFDGKVAVSNRGHANVRQSSIAFYTKGEGEFNQSVLWSSSSSQKHHDNLNNVRSGLLLIEDDCNINRLDLSIQDGILANDLNIAKKEMDREHGSSGKKSNINLDYGIADPLEFARQVAIEVEREVVDYREQSCSSDELPDRHIQQSHSSDSVSHNQSRASDISSKQAANDSPGTSSSMEEDSATNSENLDVEQVHGTKDMEISQVTEVSQEEINKERALCNIDLNVDVCSEDAASHLNQFPAPVSVVSASRAMAAPGLRVAPLKFEGNLGWKGSAVTSAFRPASSHKKHESVRDHSGWGSSSSTKQRQGLLDIDLNVAESGDVRTGVVSSDKKVPATSSLPSGESSVEMNSKSELIELDLNLVSEDGCGALIDWGRGQLFPHRNARQCLSNSSSSSSKQPSLKNIDLNDHPSFPSDSFELNYLSELSQNLNFPGGVKSDGSVISIMGTRVELNQKDLASQTLPFPHNRSLELPFDINLGRMMSFDDIGPVLPCVHSSVYGYTQAPPAMPLPSTIYESGGPIPYMVDSRGGPVIPQVVGPTPALPTTFSQPAFIINGIGSSQSSFDLNSVTMMEGANRDPTSLGLSLNSGPVRLMDEQLRWNSHPNIGSVIAGKRKEPEHGWEHYPFQPHTPPWT